MASSLDTLLANEKPEVVRQAQLKADRILMEIRLSEVRALLQKTQKDMAEAMGVTQPTDRHGPAGTDLRTCSPGGELVTSQAHCRQVVLRLLVFSWELLRIYLPYRACEPVTAPEIDG